MSYQIPDECPACGSCLSNCPTDAITVKDQKFYIDPKLCNYCEGYYPEPQCIITCPTSLPSPSIAKKGRSKTIESRVFTSPDLFFQGKTNHPLASAMVIWEACNLLSQQESLAWNIDQNDSCTLSRPINSGKGEMNFWITDQPNQDSPKGLKGKLALKEIQSFDIRSACMHLIYAAYATTLEQPWEQFFLINDRQIEAYLGLDKRKDLSKIDKLKLIKKIAQQPCLILTEIHWPSQGKIRAFSVEKNYLWRLLDIQHHFQEDESGCKHLVGLTFKVQPGMWSQYFLNQADARQATAFYQYSSLPQSLLNAVMSYWQQHPGAVRMMVWLLFKTRMGEEQRITVTTLMRVGYGNEKILRASSDREERKRRLRTFESDLAVLDQYGLKPIFDTETYPLDIQPLWAKLADLPDDADAALDFWINDGSSDQSLTDNAPRGKWNRLMNARLLGFKLPSDWTKHKTKAEKKRQRSSKQVKKVHQLTLSGEQIITARKNRGWSQRELAERIGKSQSWIRDIENGRFNAKKEEQSLLRDILQLENFERARSD
jgi:DNA-binding transcriptional regulator YiaG